MKNFSAAGKKLKHSILALGVGANILLILLRGLVKPYPWRFSIAVLLGFGSRMMQIIGFVVSIQALRMAFQFVTTDGQQYQYSGLIKSTGLPTEWMPVMVAMVVVIVFTIPAIFKAWEAACVGGIIRDLQSKVISHQESLNTDIFVAARVPVLYGYAIRFLSGVLFIVASFIIISFFSLQLLLVISITSILVASLVIVSNSRNMSYAKEALSIRALYFEEARNTQKTQIGSRGLPSLTDTPALTSKHRHDFLTKAFLNWEKTYRAVFNQGIFLGAAMAFVVWITFRLDSIDSSRLVLLIFLVIAIRYAINTARETGAMMTKLLDARSEFSDLKKLAALNA